MRKPRLDVGYIDAHGRLTPVVWVKTSIVNLRSTLTRPRNSHLREDQHLMDFKNAADLSNQAFKNRENAVKWVALFVTTFDNCGLLAGEQLVT
mmetsp:Transcript_98535/g.180285  ORF Transcript_98535/g.180285 Transcript_98535/m.180285 type:complete len:93 (-) Transcript_98535:173-451(-)